MENIQKLTKENYNSVEKHSNVKFSIFKLLRMILCSTVITAKIMNHKIFNLFKRKIPKDISNKTVLVTGGGNGLGRALSIRFAKEGCKIAIADIDYNNAQKTAKEIREKYKVDCEAFECDITNDSAVLKMKSEIEKSLGPVDILVNNAGFLHGCRFESCCFDDIGKIIELNLTSQIKMTHRFLSSMIARKYGHIITIASIGSLSTVPGGTIYCASKWGLNGFMSTLYDELHINKQDKFINVTTVYPQFIETRKELSELLDKAEMKLPRFTPEYVADKAVEGMLLNKTKIIVASLWLMQYEIILIIVRLLPVQTRKFIFKSIYNVEKVQEIFK